MILRLSRQNVRQTWPAYLGAFVALVFGVVLLGVTVALIGAVARSAEADDVTLAERTELNDLSSMFGTMSGISLFMAVFVVGSTFGFVVATRRRELGLARLIGATPRQVRRMILLESGVVAVAASVVGALASTALTPVALWAIRAYGLTDLHLDAPPAWLAWSIAVPVGVAVALMGAWRSSKRASRVPPAAALREANVERRRPGVVQLLVALVCAAAVVAVAVVARDMPPLFAMVVAIFLPELLVIGVMCVGTLLLPASARLLARPFVGAHVTARLARDQLTAASRTTAALAAPVVAISGIACSLIVTLSFVADWTTAQDRAQLEAPLVVATGGNAEVADSVAADPAVAVADERRRVGLTVRGEREDVDVVDLEDAGAARGLRAVRGSLDDLHGATIAVSETWTTDAGGDVGDTLPARVAGKEVRLRIAAVVPDAPGLYGEMLVPEDLVAPLVAETPPELVFVVPEDDENPEEVRAALVAGMPDGGRVLTAEEYLAENDAASRRANSFGLWILLGPAGLYAAIAMVNATLVGASQRRRQDAVIRLLGATPRQVRHAAMWEAAFIGGAGLVIGGLIAAFCAGVVRLAVDRDVPGAATTIPWPAVLGIGGTCLLLVVTAALAGARVHVVAGRNVPEPDPA
ncbi:putative ABC transport system permease protein [Nocardioides thalensis]|uniref:Putative ABC transport system permease protein n=1 Tax=Nocardioides thalensis TaxID=1914755 RepID=A0A853C7N8_9ACTN|nr:FtsX-like permease family protein [Nocardioides thalensis]NYJ03026.1 putative ABC transport system permease protein [Nocardioides thalensis]